MNKYLEKIASKLSPASKQRVKTVTNIFRRAGRKFKRDINKDVTPTSPRESKLIERLTRKGKN